MRPGLPLPGVLSKLVGSGAVYSPRRASDPQLILPKCEPSLALRAVPWRVMTPNGPGAQKQHGQTDMMAALSSAYSSRNSEVRTTEALAQPSSTCDRQSVRGRKKRQRRPVGSGRSAQGQSSGLCRGEVAAARDWP